MAESTMESVPGRHIEHSTSSRNWGGIGLVILATLLWSTGGIFLTAVVAGSGIMSLGLAFWRVLATFTCLLVGLLIIRPRLLRVDRRDLIWFAGMGALATAMFQVLWILAVLTNGLSVSTVIQCNAPIIVTVLAWVFWREPLTWRKWTAIGLALAGTFLISQPTAANTVQITALGLLISLASAMAYAAITLFAKKLTGDYNPWTILLYNFGFAALALLPFQFALPLPESITTTAWAAFVAFVLITTIGGYTAYTAGLGRLPASVASIIAMTEVPFAAFWGYVVLNERLDIRQIAGALLVVAGVVVLSWLPRARSAEVPVDAVPPA